MFDLSEALGTLPPVPDESRGASGFRDLFVAEAVSPQASAELSKRGWRIKDVRLLEGGDRVRGVLAGLGTGTIDPKWVDLKQLELDAKVHGLLGRDAGQGDKPREDLGEATLDALLELAPSRFAPEKPVAPTKKPKAGRPPGSKNKKTLAIEAAATPIEQVKEILKQ